MDFLRIAAALGSVFALLGTVYFVSNRAKTPSAVKAFRASLSWPRNRHSRNALDNDSVRVLKRVSLTATHQLHLIATTGGAFLLCTHPQGCTLLRTRTGQQTNRENADSQNLGRYAS
jgi:hypothetical protein